MRDERLLELVYLTVLDDAVLGENFDVLVNRRVASGESDSLLCDTLGRGDRDAKRIGEICFHWRRRLGVIIVGH